MVQFKFQQVYFVIFMVTQLFYNKLPQKPKYLLLHGFNEYQAWNFEIIAILKYNLEQGIMCLKNALRSRSFCTYAKYFRKTNIPYPLIRMKCQFSENFAYVLNEWSPMTLVQVSLLKHNKDNKLSGEVCCLSSKSTKKAPERAFQKIFRKLTFLTPWYAHLGVRIRG